VTGLLLLLAMSGRHKDPAPPAEIPEIRPMAAPADFASTIALAYEGGQTPPIAVVPICRPVAEQLSLCFVKGGAGDLDYVTGRDLQGWGLDATQLEERAKTASAKGFSEVRPALASVEGMSGHYWVSAEADGLDAAGLLDPAQLARIAGAPPVVAVPVQGALLFWVPGDGDLDKVMAVAVRRMYDSSAQKVSPLIYRWQDTHWAVWGRAVKDGDIRVP